ncbi:MAG: glycosyltransferase family 2 protein [Chitinophagaceae bacterium]|nr:glycosyltransferase family 2 protein [Chitinophagaceae bacterium]
MKISGFTFTRNATKLYYPVKESIQSILPLVDEFIVALGQGDEDDHTEDEVRSIHSDKIKIIHTQWDLKKYTNGTEYAHQTDIAKNACTGDWLFYLQSDELVHEKYLPAIKENCEKYLERKDVDGFLFNYKHFWGDYQHYILSHVWYPKEIRIIRNDPAIHSWKDAQSFRRIPNFDGLNYDCKEGTEKLNVVQLEAWVFHYGFVRPPAIMQRKRKNHNTNYHGEGSTKKIFEKEKDLFDYGDLNKLKQFKETHPKVMDAFIKKFNWREQLKYDSKRNTNERQKHEKLKYRILSAIEQKILGGKQLFGFKNYKIIKPH